MLSWTLKPFSDLTPNELYDILRLRSEVFVVEQNCVFQDMDNKDQQSWHLMGWQKLTPESNPELVTYTRLLPPGLAYEFPSIGRVITSKVVRNNGTGKLLMLKSIEEITRLFGKNSIRIGAQLYLKKFYSSFGFEQSSEVYDEDGIDHIEMTRP